MPNFDLLRAKYNELTTADSQKNDTKFGDNFWKPTPEAQIIRVLPYKFNPDTPFSELYFYYDLVPKRTILSPSSKGEFDPIVKFAEEMKVPGDSESWKTAKSLMPKLRTYAPVIVRGKEAEGTKFWGFGKLVYQELLRYMMDEEYGDFTDAVNGYDFKVWTVKEAGQNYPKTFIQPARKSSPISTSPEILEIVMNGQKELIKLYDTKTPDELMGYLHKYLNPEESVPENVVGQNTNNTGQSVSSAASNIADQFADQFDTPADSSIKTTNLTMPVTEQGKSQVTGENASQKVTQDFDAIFNKPSTS